MFKGTHFCIPKCGTHELLIREIHGGSLPRHYDVNKTLIMLRTNYFWPGMSKDMQDILRRCATCQMAKSYSFPQGSYTPLPAPTFPTVDVNVDFILGFPKTQRKKDFIFMMVDRVFKMAHFISYYKTNDAT